MLHEELTIKMKKGSNHRTINATSIIGSGSHTLIVEDINNKNQVYARKIYVGSLHECQLSSFNEGWFRYDTVHH